MVNEFLTAVRQAAITAVEETAPTEVIYGKVISIAPLKIQIDQKIILGPAQLVLTRNVTDYTLEMTVDHETENATHGHGLSGVSGSVIANEHKHACKGKKAFIVHNALKVGERVLLIATKGGQSFIVVDRMVGL